MATRIVRVFLRTKSSKPDVHQSVKVVTNSRVPGRKQPIQIHLGYLSLMFDGGIPEGQRKKLRRNLHRMWFKYFQNDEVDIDWDHAERKLAELRDRYRYQPEHGPAEDRRCSLPNGESIVSAQMQSTPPDARGSVRSATPGPALEPQPELWQVIAAVRK